jgi:FAD/FMN-containing dehydrogenase
VSARKSDHPALEPTTIDTLKAGVRGPVLVPGDAGYDDARAVWNGMIDRKPAVIARCRGTADVVACVNVARETGVPVTIKGGGHNIAGLAVCDGGITLDMSLMRGVFVDPDARIAHAQAGCLLGDVDRETQVHGLAAVLGFVSETGVAGLTLGGGFGYLTRSHGWTSDNVVSMRVVTADGRVVRASADENADLFWGLCGGGGNFGVVTDFEYKLYPVGPEVMAGAVAWRGEDAPAVLEMYAKVMETAPPGFVCVAGLRMAPPAPWLPAEYHGKLIVALFPIHTGSVQEGKKIVAPMKAFGKPIGDVVQPRPYTQQQSLLDPTQPRGRRYYWKSEYLPGLTPALFDTFIAHGKRILSPHSAVLLFPLGGALGALPAEHSAVGNRDASFALNIAGSWESAADDAANITWARDAWEDLREFSTGGTYINFQTEDEGDERIRAAYGDNYDRLVKVKTAWDPHNLFCVNKNIVPAGK